MISHRSIFIYDGKNGRFFLCSKTLCCILIFRQSKTSTTKKSLQETKSKNDEINTGHIKSLLKTAPSYLSDLLEKYVPSRLLRSGSQNLLKIPPRANKKCTEKAFKHCAPYIWNSLPSDIREAKSESQFKNDLKTHLFKSHLCI